MRSILLGLSLYAYGLVFYSALFLATPNQDPLMQVIKISVSAFHCFVIMIPVYLSQSRKVIIRLLGYAILACCIVYSIFLVGFFQYFGFVPELYAYGFGNAEDVTDVIDHYFVQVFGFREVMLLGISPIIIYITIRHKVSKRLLVLPCLSAILLGASIAAYGLPAENERLGNATIIRRFGPLVFAVHSIDERLTMDVSAIAPETEYPGKISNLPSVSFRHTPAMDPPRGIRNVVLIQIESFDPQAIDAKLSGIRVMPFVKNLRERCLSYKNYFTLKGAGGSSDAEFSIATGLLPSMTVPSLSHFDYSKHAALYERLAKEDIISTFSHNNQSGFYDRKTSYASMSGVSTHFLNPSSPTDELGFAMDGLATSLAMTNKGFHYFFNFSSHGPYRGYSHATEQRFSSGETRNLRFDYLATMSEVDDLIEQLFMQQRAGFDQGETLFVLTADHPSYVFSDGDILERFRVPLFLCHVDLPNRIVESVSSTLDLHATILDIFGIPQNGILGRTLFDGGSGAALLPNRTLVHSGVRGNVRSETCSDKCDPFVSYTEQYLSLNP